MASTPGPTLSSSTIKELGYTLDCGHLTLIFGAVNELADKKEQVFDEEVEALVLENV